MTMSLHIRKEFQWTVVKTVLLLNMDRKQIASLATKMQTKEDLLNLLNLIKKEEMKEAGFDVSQIHPFTLKQINYYCNPNHVFHRYRQFKIRKKSGGFRQITSPRNQSFMMLLQATNEILKSLYNPSDYAMGFVEGRSVVSNANCHIGQNYVFNIDLKDFFPSISQVRVWSRLQAKPYNMHKQIASLIAGLCSMRIKREIVNENANHNNDKQFLYVLPQGAPTSPVLTNMICERLDQRLGGLAKRFGLHYTRYADDITFSSMHYVYSKNGDFRKELKRIIEDQGFTINDKKTRLQKRGTRQEVTGIIVNDKLNVTQRYIRDVRNILHIWGRYGYGDAVTRFLPKYKEEKGYVKKGNPDLINVLDGKLLYLKMVKGDNDRVYSKLHDKYKYLVEETLNEMDTNSKGTTFISTYNLSSFEKNCIFSDVEIIIKEDGKPYAAFSMDGVKVVASVDSKLKSESFNKKEDLAISLCRGADKKTFWLIHKKHKLNVPLSLTEDLDILIKDMDSLLNT